MGKLIDADKLARSNRQYPEEVRAVYQREKEKNEGRIIDGKA